MECRHPNYTVSLNLSPMADDGRVDTVRVNDTTVKCNICGLSASFNMPCSWNNEDGCLEAGYNALNDIPGRDN